MVVSAHVLFRLLEQDAHLVTCGPIQGKNNDKTGYIVDWVLL